MRREDSLLHVRPKHREQDRPESLSRSLQERRSKCQNPCVVCAVVDLSESRERIHYPKHLTFFEIYHG